MDPELDAAAVIPHRSRVHGVARVGVPMNLTGRRVAQVMLGAFVGFIGLMALLIPWLAL